MMDLNHCSNFHIFTEPLKMALSVEAKAWKLLIGKHLNFKFRQKMDDIFEFVGEQSKRLARLQYKKIV